MTKGLKGMERDWSRNKTGQPGVFTLADRGR